MYSDIDKLWTYELCFKYEITMIIFIDHKLILLHLCISVKTTKSLFHHIDQDSDVTSTYKFSLPFIIFKMLCDYHSLVAGQSNDNIQTMDISNNVLSNLVTSYLPIYSKESLYTYRISHYSIGQSSLS